MAKAKTYDFHPLADAFPLMEGQEFAELVADIEANGQQKPIIIYDGKILDGRNRYRACVQLGIDPHCALFPILETHEHALAYVTSANIHRRHLDPDAKRKSIEALLAADPTASDRAIADKAKTNHKKVGRVRKRMEAEGGTGVPPAQRVGKDGKTYPAPAPKPDPIPEVAAPPKPEASQAEASALRASADADDADFREAWQWMNSIRLLHSGMRRSDIDALARAARCCDIPQHMIRELAERLFSLVAAIKRRASVNAVQTVADRAEERAKSAAPAGDGLDLPDDLRRT